MMEILKYKDPIAQFNKFHFLFNRLSSLQKCANSELIQHKILRINIFILVDILSKYSGICIHSIIFIGDMFGIEG